MQENYIMIVPGVYFLLFENMSFSLWSFDNETIISYAAVAFTNETTNLMPSVVRFLHMIAYIV